MRRSLLLCAVIILLLGYWGCAKKQVVSEESAGMIPEAAPAEVTAPAYTPGTTPEEETVAEETLPKEEAPVMAEAPKAVEAKPELSLTDIFFDFDRAFIRDDAKPVLEANAASLKANQGAKILLQGHCDERGTNEYNIALGEKRANAAKKYLVNLGIDALRISIVSYGEEKPFCREHNEDCWQKNRRAHFVIKK